jgi:hypothetical protein
MLVADDYGFSPIRDISKPVRAVRSGAVFVYKFNEADMEFQLEQKLNATNLKEYDRFGWRVRISNDTLLIASLKESGGRLRVRAAVQAITLTAKPGAEALGNTFKGGWVCLACVTVTPAQRCVILAVQWMVVSSGGQWVRRQTRNLDHAISHEDLRQALEEDLDTGSLRVTRSKVDERYVSHADA